MAAEAADAFDVCIVGAGPGGLSALSSILEPYSHDHLTPEQAERAATCSGHSQQSVCVVDPEPWLGAWNRRFEELGIRWLRSPAMAHPDVFDAWNLMAFAKTQGRSEEMQPAGAEQWKAIRGLHTVGAGLFGLPSSSLFSDFCAELTSRLPHTFVRERAASIEGCDGAFEVRLANGRSIKSRAVVLALGFPGPAIVPPAFAGLPADVAFHTEDCDRLSGLAKGQRVLVIGGGLTAVQTAQLAMRKGCRTTLISRRQLVTRQFDIPLQWFDFRIQGKLRHEFWSEPVEGRLTQIRATRGGGSVPPSYMEQLRASEAAGHLTVLHGEVEACNFEGGVVEAAIRGEEGARQFDRVVLACGHRPGCLDLPLLADLCRRWPTPIQGGLPVLSEDLQWGDMAQLFVVGALAGLQVGPDAANLMGCRRAAQVVAQALGLRSWLRKAAPASRSITVCGNRYLAFQSESEDGEGASTDADADGSDAPTGGDSV